MYVKSFISVAAIAAVTGLAATSALAQTWNAAADFSMVSNPGGTWSYGTRALPNGTLFSLFSNTFTNGPLVGWRDNANSASFTPAVWKNSAVSTFVSGSVTSPALSVLMHPGPVGFGPAGSREYVVTRWTSPVTDLISMFGSFDAADVGSTSVFIVINGTTLFSAIRFGGGNVPFSASVPVVTGDTVDFVVGNNGNFNNDSTVLNATIIPAPAAAALLGLGGLMGLRRRR